MLSRVTSTTLSYREFYRARRAIIGSFAISDIQFQVDRARIARYMEIAGRSRGFCPAFSGGGVGPNAYEAVVANKGCADLSRHIAGARRTKKAGEFGLTGLDRNLRRVGKA